LFCDELTGEFGKSLEKATVDDCGLLGRVLIKPTDSPRPAAGSKPDLAGRTGHDGFLSRRQEREEGL
jgi:hypothetical protein